LWLWDKILALWGAFRLRLSGSESRDSFASPDVEQTQGTAHQEAASAALVEPSEPYRDQVKTHTQSEPFVRVLDPSDPWLNERTLDERVANFRGKPEWDISVAMETRCAPLTVLAALYGARREVGLVDPAYYLFTEREVLDVGGQLKDTPADPPWPGDYNHAHHDVVASHMAVATHMAELYALDNERVRWPDELEVLRHIADLLARQDVHQKYEKGATYRFRRMFEDGGNERRLWIEVAKSHHFLLDQPTVSKELRKMHQNKEKRAEWAALMDGVGIPEAERVKYR
jgi:hypothetical protein